ADRVEILARSQANRHLSGGLDRERRVAQARLAAEKACDVGRRLGERPDVELVGCVRVERSRTLRPELLGSGGQRAPRAELSRRRRCDSRAKRLRPQAVRLRDHGGEAAHANRRLTGSAFASMSFCAALRRMKTCPLSSVTPRAYAHSSLIVSSNGSVSQSSSGAGGCTSKWP